MKPTVGRIVHYHDDRNHAFWEGLSPSTGPFAAIVTGFHESGHACLSVFLPGAVHPFSLTKVPFAEQPTAGHWNWPPRE